MGPDWPESSCMLALMVSGLASGIDLARINEENPAEMEGQGVAGAIH